jgi:hypothetical protein
MIAIQVFDHKKFKKRDQGSPLRSFAMKQMTDMFWVGFLGVINFPAAEAISYANLNNSGTSLSS